jgi:hypothetical protein
MQNYISEGQFTDKNFYVIAKSQEKKKKHCGIQAVNKYARRVKNQNCPQSECSEKQPRISMCKTPKLPRRRFSI